MRRRAWLVYLGFGALGGVCYYFIPPFAKSGPFFNVLGVSSVVAIIVGTRLHRPERRLPWYLFAAGQALFIAGDVITYNYDRLFHKEIPFPSIGDFAYLSVYPCLIAGILILIRRRTPGRDRESLIDSLIITMGAALLSWEFLMRPYAHEAGLGWTVRVTSLAYPMMDLLLLAVAVRLAVGAGRREPSFYLLALGVVGLLATDAAYGMVQLSGTVYENGGPLEAGWLSFYVLWGAAALHPSMRTLADRSRERAGEHPRGRLALLAGASLMAPAVQVIQTLLGEEVEPVVAVGGTVFLFLLVIARLSGVVSKHEQAEGRERALREAAAAFVVATGRKGLYEAALEATSKLAGAGREVRMGLALEAGDEVTLVASSGEETSSDRSIRLSRLPFHIRSALEERRSIEDRNPEPILLGALGMPDRVAGIMIAPLYIKDQLHGLLAVGSDVVIPLQVRDGLDALASQTALALESAFLTEDLHRRKSEARFASLVQNSSDVTTIMAADSTIRYQSPSVRRVLGYGPEELQGTKLLQLIHPDDAPKVVALLAGNIEEQAAHTDVIEFRWRHKDGRWLQVETLSSDLTLDPNVGGIVLNTRDVSERKAFEQQLSHQAFHDSITGLANRALFRDRVEHALERQQRDDRPIAVLFMDIDDFKTINDSLGHAAGDQLLGEVAEQIRGCIRAIDTAARLGGDEFAVLLEDSGAERAAEVAERVIRVLETPVTLEGKDVFARASIGIAIGDQDRKGQGGAEELLRNADVAMYTAKNSGKGHYQVFEPEMHSTVIQRLELKADLQRAVEEGEFVLHYQPVVALEDGGLCGVEALVRWANPERGLVPPNDFIPLAEETGLIVRIGSTVLLEASREAVRLQGLFPSDPPLSMSVNISARQLQHGGLIEEVREALRMSGLRPDALILEITETAMMEDVDLSILKLNQLKDLGVRLAIDDFGTGYSSLNYLRRFPVDILKVDKSFIDEVNQGGEESALTAAILDLAGTLQLQPVAEGIERVEQLDRLVEMRCALGQGFYFARPLDQRTIEDLLEQMARGEASPSLRPPASGVAVSTT